MYYVVKYQGAFGFIKPWTAVRDGETFSQQFLTPSIIEGLRQKLEVTEILRHRLTYAAMSVQQEQIQPKAYIVKKKIASRAKSILKRGVLINPTLYLVFNSFDDALKASKQHICLCRNEDILYPDAEIAEMSEEAFNAINGFELIFGKTEKSFVVGYNRFQNAEPMYGTLLIQGSPVQGDPAE